MSKYSLGKELLVLDREVEEAMLMEPDSRHTGQLARAFRYFAERCVTESFAMLAVADDMQLAGDSRADFAAAVKQAEEEIARGFGKLALLLADPAVHATLRQEFEKFGMPSPFYGHIGMRVKADPVLAAELRKFLDNQERKGGSPRQRTKALRKFIRQLQQRL